MIIFIIAVSPTFLRSIDNFRLLIGVNYFKEIYHCYSYCNKIHTCKYDTPVCYHNCLSNIVRQNNSSNIDVEKYNKFPM